MTDDEQSDLEKTVSQVLADLHDASESLWAVTDRRTHEHLELLLTRIELGVNELSKHLSDHPAPATPEAFDALLKAIKAKWPDDERLKVISDMGPAGHYSSSQVAALLETFDFDTNKVEAAVRLYPKVVDQENFYQALDAIDEPWRDTARDRLHLK